VKKYLITDPELYTQEVKSFEAALRKAFMQHKPDYALYRDKTNPRYKELASVFVKVCREFAPLACMLHGDEVVAHELQADGVHLTFTQFENIAHAKELGLFTVASTHTDEEIVHAIALGADAVTFSPIFPSPNKGEPKGLEALCEVVAKNPIKVFALGGIVEPWHVEAIAKSGAYGFASIRYFYSPISSFQS
jgi:thiamine-phosphate pyrophosphorylase